MLRGRINLLHIRFVIPLSVLNYILLPTCHQIATSSDSAYITQQKKFTRFSDRVKLRMIFKFCALDKSWGGNTCTYLQILGEVITPCTTTCIVWCALVK